MSQTIHTDTAKTVDAACELATGLRQLARLVETHSHLAEHLSWPFSHLLVYVRTREQIRAFARAGARLADATTKHADEQWAGVDLQFGPIRLRVYGARDGVCERVVVGTHDVTEDVPDPALMELVPLVSVTRCVEDVEWRCPPLLAEEQ